MSRLARPLPNVDFKKLPLSPTEGNVFSRVDGVRSEEEIGKLTGLRLETVFDAIEKLVQVGAVEIVDQAKLAKDQEQKNTTVAIKHAFGGHLGEGDLDKAALSEDVEIEMEKRRQILDAFGRLDKLDYYELLGLHRLVDKKEIKAAYYAIAPTFHPDKFYRKNLGAFRPKIEAIFARLTLAHDVLSSKQRRAEYDEYLFTLDQNRKAQAMLGDSQRAIADAQASIEASAQEAKKQAAAELDAKRVADRKRALAAKLGRPGQGAAPGKAPANGAAPQAAAPAQAATPEHDARAAAEALRVRYEYARAEAQKVQVEGYLASGRAAAAANDFPSAANYLRIAASLAPHDQGMQQEAHEYARRASFALADGYIRQGDYEAETQQFAAAAQSYAKAIPGKPDDAKLHDKCASALQRAGGQAKRAVELARRAVELAPRVPNYRLTLAYCLASGGAEASAMAELDRTIEALKDASKEDRERVKQMVDGARVTVRELVAKSASQPQASGTSQQAMSAVKIQQSQASVPPAQAPSIPPAGSMPPAASMPPGPGAPSFGPPPQAPLPAFGPPPQQTAPAFGPPPGAGYPGQVVQQGHPQQGYPQQGHPQQAYTQQGHPQAGYPQPGHPQAGYPQQGHPQAAYPQQGHPQQGYPQQGHPQQGHPQQGHPQQGHPQQGHPQQGHPQQGHPQQGHPQQGYPQPGHPQAGYPQPGHPQAGYPQQGHPQQGQGYPQQGYPQAAPAPGGYPPPAGSAPPVAPAAPPGDGWSSLPPLPPDAPRPSMYPVGQGAAEKPAAGAATSAYSMIQSLTEKLGVKKR